MKGRPLAGGSARGRLLVAREPLSFWGGYDADTGEIIDRRHALAGENASGAVLALPVTRGSSTTTAVLLEAIRRETAPAAILTRGPDPFLALASIAADELYGRSIPIVALAPDDFDGLSAPGEVRVEADGTVERVAAPG